MFSDVHTHPFYRPLWVRISIVAVTASWVTFEYAYGNSGLFLALSAGAFVFCVWAFLLTYPKPQ
jgi:hypothetical protein